MTPFNQLSNAIHPFKQWRATRKKTTYKTSEALQQQVVEVLSHYSRGTVSNALGLSGAQVKRWQSGTSAKTAKSSSQRTSSHSKSQLCLRIVNSFNSPYASAAETTNLLPPMRAHSEF